MKRTLGVLIILVLTVGILGGLYAAEDAIASAGGLFAPVPTATGESQEPVSYAPLHALMEVRLHYCDRGNIYALLSLPRDATFSMGMGVAHAPSATARAGVTGIPNTGSAATSTPAQAVSVRSAACEEAGSFDGHTLVLCRSRGPARLTITVRSQKGSQAYVLSLSACATARSIATPAWSASRTPRP